MLETYKVGVTFELTGNVQTAIDRLISQVESLDRQVKDTGASFARLAEDIRAVGNAGRSIGQINRAMGRLTTDGSKGVGELERMATATRSVVSNSERLTGVLRENARLTADMARAAELGARASRGSAAAPGSTGRRDGRGRHSGQFGHDFMMTGMGAAMVGEPMVRGAETAFERGMEVAHLRTQILADRRVSEAQADAMVNRAYEATASAPGTRVAGNLHALIDLKQVTGSLDEADKLLPRFAQLTALLQVMDRKKGGTGDSSFAAAKAMELMGGMVDEHQDTSGHTVREINPELMQKRLDMIARVAVATNARVEPEDYLRFAKQARVAGMALSDEFIYERLPAIMLAMGGSRAGTALMSMAQVFEGGKLTNKSMEALMDIGLASPGGLTRERNPHTKKMHMVAHPEAIFDLDIMRHDPDKWVAAAQARMEAHGIHGTENQIIALMRASQRTTIAGFLADLLKDAPVIAKEQENIRATRPDIASYFAQQDPAAKMQQFQAALDKLFTTLGTAAMADAVKVLNSATDGLNSLSAWAERNPGLARLLTDTAAGLGALAVALGTLSTAIFLFGPALKALGVVSGGGAAGAAAAAGGGGLGLASRLAMGGGLAGAGILGGLALAHEGMTPLTEGQKLRHAPWLAPQDNMDWTLTTAPPTAQQNMSVRLQGPVMLDGHAVGNVVANGIARQGSGPSTGTTGVDVRTGFSGSMQGVQ